jgi:hypothetical protein
MRAMALIEDSLEPREAEADADEVVLPPQRRPDARLARLRLLAGGEVDVNAVADAIVRRLAFTAAVRADLTE